MHLVSRRILSAFDSCHVILAVFTLRPGLQESGGKRVVHSVCPRHVQHSVRPVGVHTVPAGDGQSDRWHEDA